MRHEYDFILSFAGEDRPIVEIVRSVLKANGLSVFYDLDEQDALLGKDLAEHFSYLYQESARYCVIFVSNAYLNKPWCRWERRSVLARAFKTKSVYLIPYFLETNCNIPSIPNTIGRAELKNISPREFALLLVKKYHKSVGKLDKIKLDFKEALSEALLERLTSHSLYQKIEINSQSPITTGFYSLDEKFGDTLRAGSVYIIGSRPSMGKTMFALNLVNHNITTGIRCAYTCLEESASNLIFRLLAMRAHVSTNRLRYEWIQEKDRIKLTEAMSTLHDAPLLIIDQGNEPAYDRLICELWRIAKDGQTRLIIIDHLHLLRGNTFFGSDRSIGAKTALRGIQWLAKETNATFLILCRLSRSVEVRKDKTPQLSDLYGGKSLASSVRASFLLYREDIYHPSEDNINLLDVFIVRANGRRLLPVELYFISDECRIVDRDDLSELDFGDNENDKDDIPEPDNDILF